MPVYTLASRVTGDGEVRAVCLAAFAVAGPGEDTDLLEDELVLAARVLDDINEVLEQARHDEHHRHHHYWVIEE